MHNVQDVDETGVNIWGLDRIDQSGLDGQYDYGSLSGSGVDAYVLDTGINVQHVDFAGRATCPASFVGQPCDDGNGHGTHCAGTIGGEFFLLDMKLTG